MGKKSEHTREKALSKKQKGWAGFSRIPLLGWFIGALAAVILEHFIGLRLAWALGLPKVPALFGMMTILKKPLLFPGTLLYAF
jgi:branched-chain amino acid transport system permease protein